MQTSLRGALNRHSVVVVTCARSARIVAMRAHCQGTGAAVASGTASRASAPDEAT